MDAKTNSAPAIKTIAKAARFSRGELLQGMGTPFGLRLIKKFSDIEITRRITADGIKPRADDAVRGFVRGDGDAGFEIANWNLQLVR